MIWALRTPTLTGDTAGYGQVVPLRDTAYADLRLLWHTQTGAIAAPFVPVFMGVENVPEEYRQHRYLTVGEAAKFMDMRKVDLGDDGAASQVPQGIESTRSASQVFKRLMYLVLQNQEAFLDEVTGLWQALERRLNEQSEAVAESASVLFEQGQPQLARRYLDYFTNTELNKALDLADDLARAFEARSRILYGISDAPEHKLADQHW